MQKKNSKKIRWILGIIIVIAISNIPEVSFLIGVFTSERSLYGPDFYFESSKGGFSSKDVYIENYDSLEVKFNEYRIRNPADSILCRNFKINPLKFWFWREYLFDKKYKLPYKKPEISKI